MTKILDIQNLLWLALSLALLGSLKHLAAVFATIDGNIAMGWVQAVAIDVGLFAIAYQIRMRKAARRGTRFLWFGVSLFTAISVYGNYAYGLMAASGSLPAWIVASKSVVLSATLPVLVLFLAELLSDDRQHEQRQAELAAKRVAKKRQLATGNTEDSGNIAATNDARVASKTAKKAELAALLATHPEATVTELATMLAVSRGTVRNYKSELAANGKNGYH